MASIPSSYRETNPTGLRDENRYSPSDVLKLTNQSSPSPLLTPDSAHEPPAEYTNNGRTVDITDKRATAHIVGPLELNSLRYVRTYQGSRQHASIHKTAVQEAEGGKLP